MSDLRKQLEEGRSEHQAVRYPGNLADDLAHRQRFRIESFLKIAIPITVAACVALVIYFERPRPMSLRPGNNVVAIKPSHTPTPADQTESADVVPIAPALPMTPTPAEVPSALSFPTDLPTSADTSMTTTPATPSMPSWSDTESTSSSSTL
jgi:hypothetical protein